MPFFSLGERWWVESLLSGRVGQIFFLPLPGVFLFFSFSHNFFIFIIVKGESLMMIKMTVVCIEPFSHSLELLLFSHITSWLISSSIWMEMVLFVGKKRRKRDDHDVLVVDVDVVPILLLDRKGRRDRSWNGWERTKGGDSHTIGHLLLKSVGLWYYCRCTYYISLFPRMSSL